MQKRNLSHLLSRTKLMAIILLLLISCTPKHKESNKWVGKLRPEYTTILGVAIGYPSFQEIIKKFGKAKQFELPLERFKKVYLCYTSKASHNTIAVVFARPERNDDVESIYVSQYNVLAELISCAPKGLKEYCVTNNKIPNSISVGDLTLGMTREEIHKKWGNPSYLNDNIMVYTYYSCKKMNDELIKKLYPELHMRPFIRQFQYVYIASSIKLLFKNNKLVGFGIYRSFLPTSHEYFPNESNTFKP